MRAAALFALEGAAQQRLSVDEHGVKVDRRVPPGVEGKRTRTPGAAHLDAIPDLHDRLESSLEPGCVAYDRRVLAHRVLDLGLQAVWALAGGPVEGSHQRGDRVVDLSRLEAGPRPPSL